jgi:hypothetical protein
MRSHESRIAATDLDECSALSGETKTKKMGKVLVTASVENLDDLSAANKGSLSVANVRRVEVTDALVDTGATGLLLPRKLIAQLGLDPLRIRTAKAITEKFRCKFTAPFGSPCRGAIALAMSPKFRMTVR